MWKLLAITGLFAAFFSCTTHENYARSWSGIAKLLWIATLVEGAVWIAIA